MFILDDETLTSKFLVKTCEFAKMPPRIARQFDHLTTGVFRESPSKIGGLLGQTNLATTLLLVEIQKDNRGCIAIANATGSSERTKHIDIKHHFVREKIQSGEIQMNCPTKEMTADILIKGLNTDLFQHHRRNFGITNLKRVGLLKSIIHFTLY